MGRVSETQLALCLRELDQMVCLSRGLRVATEIMRAVDQRAIMVAPEHHVAPGDACLGGEDIARGRTVMGAPVAEVTKLDDLYVIVDASDAVPVASKTIVGVTMNWTNLAQTVAVRALAEDTLLNQESF